MSYLSYRYRNNKKQSALKHLVSVNIFISYYYNFHIWKLINITGVDLNSQFPANWELGKKIKSNLGFNKPAPRDFAGESPLSEPESQSMYNFTLLKNFSLCLCFHSQGEVIYWKYTDFLPSNSLELAKEFAHVSGYELEDTPYTSSFGGFRDWFIKNFNKPGFTIEVRKR